MAKNTNGSTNLSISKSQKNAGKRLAKKAVAKPIERGGICSACGQISTSCTTGTAHHGCVGYVGKPTENFDFGDAHLNKLGDTYAMAADGTIIDRPIAGFWINKDTLMSRRVERALEAKALLKKRVIMTSVFVEVEPEPTDDPTNGVNLVSKFSHLDIRNGLGEPLLYSPHKGWYTESDVIEYIESCELPARDAARDAANDHDDSIEMLDPDQPLIIREAA
jgi:hypothetical protein